jgi:hypothetical protein
MKNPVYLVAILTGVALAAIPRLSLAASPIDVGSRKQVLIDNRFFATSKNVVLRMNPATKKGPVLLPDKPWESMDIGYCVSVVEDQGQYKMWYLARDREAM